MTLLFAIAPTSRAQTEQYEKWEHGLGDYGQGDSWILPEGRREELDALMSRWSDISRELESTDNEFAGTYRGGGEMRQSVLRWSPESGFVYVYVYEWYSVLDFSYGKVTVTPSGVVFTVERDQTTKEPGDFPRAVPNVWIPAKWRESNYLIPRTRITDFGNYAAGLGVYNDFNGPCCEFTPFLVIRGESAGRVERPVVPEQFTRYIKQPIEAKVMYVGHRRIVKDYVSSGELYSHLHQRASLTPIKINAGKRAGVKPKMLFRLIDAPESYGQYLKITRVGLSSSTGVIVRDADDNGRETYHDSNSDAEKTFPPVTVGTRVTTSPR